MHPFHPQSSAHWTRLERLRVGDLTSTRRHRRTAAAIIAVTLIAAACGSDGEGGDTGTTTASIDVSPSAPATTDATSPQALDQATVDAAAAAFLEGQAAQGVTAFYIAVSDPNGGGDVVAAYGDASVGGPAATVDDSFRIGSISKTFTATIILQLVEEGKLALDDTVGDQLPALAADHPELSGLTVEQLLAMKSGVADYLNLSDEVLPVIVDDPSTVWAPEALVAAGVNAGVTEPGTLGYSTTNYIILQLMAESVTGSTLQELIATNIADPLGLGSTVLPPNDDTTLPSPATSGYIDGGCVDEVATSGATVEPGTDTTDWNASYGQGGGGMTSTLPDLLTWSQSMVGSSLLDEATALGRLEVEVLPEGIPYGQGIMAIGPWIGHEGEAIGWEALAVQDAESGVSVALAANGCGGLFTGFLEVLETLYPESLAE